MAHFKKLTFLKVLTTVAWADGEVTESELNILKSFYRKFNLDKEELAELKPYLAAPVSSKEQEELYRQLIDEMNSARERDEIITSLENMARAGRRLGDEEKELVARFQALLQKSTLTRRSLGKMRNLLHQTLFVHVREKDPDLEKYFKRKVLKKIELKAARQGIKMNMPEDTAYFICLFGTLLAAVAHADDHFAETEQNVLKKVLSERFSFTRNQLKVLLEVVAEQARHGFDYHEVTTEIRNITPYNERLRMTDCLFAIAGADGEISHEETEEIRRITKALRISHKVFIEYKMKALSRLR